MFVEIISAIGSLTTTGLGILAVKNKKPIKSKDFQYDWKFSPAHIEVQRRIDDILGEHFTPTYTMNKGSGVWVQSADLSIVANYAKGIVISNSGTGFIGNSRIDVLVAASKKFGNNYVIVYLQKTSEWIAIYNGYLQIVSNGWQGNNGMAYKSTELACQGIFHEAVAGGYLPKISLPPDTYKSYSYPSPETVHKYGNNLGYFVRCHPEETFCQLFGFTPTTLQIVLFVASVVVTIASFGSTWPAVAGSIANIVGSAAKFSGSASLQKTESMIGALINIYNGADIIMSNGDKKTFLDKVKDYVEGNPALTTKL